MFFFLFLNAFSTDAPVAIIGAPFWKGQGKRGTEKAPGLLRKRGLVKKIRALGYKRVTDTGDLPFKDNPKDQKERHRNKVTEVKHPYSVADATRLMQNKVEQLLRQNQQVIVLGGDHSLTAGAILANNKVNKDLCLIYVDAHGDINTCESTTSGNMHGMPLSFVIKEIQSLQNNYKACPPMAIFKPSLSAKDVGYITVRALDPSEVQTLKAFNIKHYSMEDMNRVGINAAVEDILTTVCGDKTKIHVSFDVDSLDPAFTRNTGTPVKGGLTMIEVKDIAAMIQATGKLNVFELYEVNPELAPKRMANRTVANSLNILLAFLTEYDQNL